MMQVQKVRKGYKKVKSLFGKYEEIPEEWNFIKLDQITRIRDGDWILDENYSKSGIRLLQVGDIGLGKFVDKSWKFISEDTAKELKCKIIQQGKDILISRMPEPIGRACLSPTLSYDYIVAVDVSIVEPNNEIVVPYFLTYYLNSKINLDKMQKYVTGTTRQRISRKNLEQTAVILPPLKEQQKIASILSNVDFLINQTQKEIELNKKLKKGLMQKLLTKGIGHTKFKESSLKVRFLKLTIPENWKVDSLIHICKIIDTPHYTSPLFDDELIPVITTTNCDPNGQIDYSKVNFTSKEEYLKRSKVIDPEIGDLLFTREAPLGIAAFVDKKEISVGQRIILLKINKKVMTSKFLVFFLNSEIGRLQSNSLAIKTTVERVNISDIKQFKIPIPPLAEQERIVSILSNIDSQIQKQQECKSHLESLKKGLMQKLLTGKIRVKV